MNSRLRMTAWVVWILVSIFYAYQYVLRVMPNVLLGDIMDRFQIGAGVLGQFSGVYYIGYSLMHLPMGILLDRLGPRKVMPACILLTVLGLVPLLVAKHWAYPIVGRILIGVGSSAAILGLFKIVRMVFKEAHFSRMLGFSVTIGLLGAIYGGGPVGYMRAALGYETVILLFCITGLVLALATYWIVPEQPAAEQGNVLSSVKEVLSNRKVLGLCFLAGFMVGPLEGFADVWGTIFLKEVYGLESTLASSLPSMIFLGMCFGAPLLSLVAERLKSSLKTIVWAGTVMCACFMALLFLSSSPGLLSVYFLLIGVGSAYQILAIHKASTFVRTEVAGLATALANMIIMLFGYGFHTAIGGVVGMMGGPSVSKALLLGVTVVPVGLLIGTGGFLLFLRQEKKAISVSV